MRVVMIIEMSWQVNEEVSWDMTGEADGKNPGVDSTDGVMHIWMSDLWFSMGWLKLQDRTMTDKLAGPDIAGQTSKACILSELSK